MKKRRLIVQPMAFLFLLWMLVSDRSRVGLITVFAAGLHECGHLLMAKCLHIPMRNLSLDVLGARLDVSGRMLSYTEEWLLCAAGPIGSLLASAVASLLWQNFPYAIAFSCASFLLGLLNLLPIRTFDGGRMLEVLLLSLFSVQTAYRVLRTCSFFFLLLIWSIAVYFILRANDGLSLLCFSMSLFSRFFEEDSDPSCQKSCSIRLKKCDRYLHF